MNQKKYIKINLQILMIYFYDFKKPFIMTLRVFVISFKKSKKILFILFFVKKVFFTFLLNIFKDITYIFN